VLLTFTLRILFAYAIVLLIMFATLYNQHQYRMRVYIEKLQKQMVEHVRNQLKHNGNVRLREQVRDAVGDLHIPYLEIYDGKRRLLNTFVTETWPKVKSDVSLPAIPAPGEEDYEHISTKAGDFLVFASGPMEINNPYGFKVVRAFRGVFPIDQTTLEGIKKHFINALRLVLLTGLVFAVTLFPMIFYYYRRLRERNKALIRSYFNTISALGSAVAQRDGDTSSHNYRVTLYTLRLAEAMKCCNKEQIASMILGAYLHDIGKIGIPDRILLKHDRLTDDEFALMQQHVDKGLKIVSRIEWMHEAAKLIGGHHEKFDGTGYPKGLRGKAIPLEARIFTVADVFDALNSRRPYKAPLDLDTSVAMIRKLSGTHFDPEVVDVFLRIVPEIRHETMHLSEQELEALLQKEIEPYISTL
jgi:putative nucleotidyltransferase with HDIG domain